MRVARGRNLSSEIYAAFKDDVAFSIRDMKQFLRKGGRLSLEEITAILDKLYINLAQEIEDNDLDEDRAVVLLDRAEQYLEAAQIKFVEIPLYADVISEEGEDVQIDISEESITIEGEEYAIVDGSSYFALKRAGIHRRGRTITSFSELVDYVNGVPYVYGIEIVYNVSGTIVGYRVWVSDYAT
jgi:hypothetical protein